MKTHLSFALAGGGYRHLCGRRTVAVPLPAPVPLSGDAPTCRGCAAHLSRYISPAYSGRATRR